MPKKLLYHVVPHNGSIVFAQPERAAFIDRIQTAIETSHTWGEFRKAMPREEYSKIVRSIDDCGEPRPCSTDVFEAEQVPGYMDGDYPPWLQQEMHRYIPMEILKKYGERNQTTFNGDFWMIPEKNLEAICTALTALDWELEQAPDLQFH